MNKRLLLVYPHDKARDLLASRTDVIFLDYEGWWEFDKSTSTRHLVPLNEVETKYAEWVNPKTITDKISWWTPMWHRWVANADQYELLKRNALLFILKIIGGLRYFDVRVALFHTAVSHHIDTSMIEIACGSIKIPQIFLYPNVINGRLLPLLQQDYIDDRQPLGEKISSYDSSNDVKDFYINKTKNQLPVSSPVKFRSLDQNIYYARYRLIFEAIKSTYVNKRTAIFGDKKKLNRAIIGENPISLTDHLRLIEQQEKATNFYMENCLSPQRIRENFEEKERVPLIAAHYQPEATSFPEGGDWNNHIDIVLRLRSLGVKGDIAYKEHPGSWIYHEPIVGATQVGMYRSVQYFRQLLDLGCKFLPPDYQLSMEPNISTWYLPISITGSICVERSLFGLYSIYTGHPVFKGMPGSYSLDDTVVLENLLRGETRLAEFRQEDSFNYLSELLRETTIVNVLGIGTGNEIMDEGLSKKFSEEYLRLIEILLAKVS